MLFRDSLLLLAAVAALDPSHSDAQDRFLIQQTNRCRDCEIVLTPTVVLRGAAVEGEPLAIVRLSDGRFLSSYYPGGDVIAEFASDGTALGPFATKGQGPAEVAYVTRIQPLGTDSVVVFEAGNARASVFTLDGKLGRTFQVPGRINDSAVLAQGGFATNGLISTPEYFGLPLQILLEDGQVDQAFGGVEGGLMRPDMPQLGYRRVATDGKRIWAATPTNYEVSEWSAAGQERHVWVRGAAWFEAYFDDRVFDPQRKFPPWLMDIEYMGANRLATVVHVGASDWRDHLGEPYELRSGGVVYPDWDVAAVHETVVEIIDVQSGQLQASTRFPGYSVGFLDSEHLGFYETSPTGEPSVAIFKVSVRQR